MYCRGGCDIGVWVGCLLLRLFLCLWIGLFLLDWRVIFFGVFVLVFCLVCVVGVEVNRFGTDSCRRQVRMKWRNMNSSWGVWWVQW